ncbi:MAG: YceD family protein [Terriglobales bacterium]
MFIRLQDLEVEKLEFQQEFGPGVIDLGAEVAQQTTLRASGRAELIKEDHGRKKVIRDIRVVGRLSTRVEVRCARCLEPVTSVIESAFDLLYRPLGADAGKDEVSISEAETEIGYYQGEGLLLEDVLREQVLLATPVRTLCREDCKGLCPRCGRNRNREECQCAEQPPDPRWEALKGIREKLKH